MQKKTLFEFGIHPAVKMLHAWTMGLQEKTGHTLEEWAGLAQASGLKTQKEKRAWLKGNFQFSTMHTTWIVEIATGKGWGGGSPEAYLKAAHEYIEAMFAGPKASLRPIYEVIISLSYQLGKDVKACPCKTIIPLYRRHVFAQIKPSARSRMDLGLALGNLQPPPRLISTGGYEKKDGITHRIPLTHLNEIDEEVKHWLTMAYQLDV